MADIGNSTVFIGSPDWYIGDPESYPVSLAKLHPPVAQTSINFRAKIDAEGIGSEDPLGDRLFFEWSIARRPPKSRSDLSIDLEGERAVFLVDDVGVYAIGLVVYGANGGASDLGRCIVIGQPSSAPYNRTEYSVKWLWNALPDFWANLESRDKARIETFWAGVQSLVGADLLELYNAKDCLSIRDVQGVVAKKWLPIDLTLPLSGLFYAGASEVSAYELDGKVAVTASKSNNAFTGTLIRGNLLYIPFVPCQKLDIGRPISIYHQGNKYSSRIISRGSGVHAGSFIVEAVNLESYLYPLECSVSLLSPPYQSNFVVKVGSEYHVGLPKEAYILTEADYYDGVEVSIPIQMQIDGAEVNGISLGDEIVVRVTETFKNVSFEITYTVQYVEGNSVVATPNTTIEEVIALYVDDTIIRNEILEEISSSKWRERYLGSWLTTVDGFSSIKTNQYELNFVFNPYKALLRSRVLVDSNITSLFKLTERTGRTFYEDGQILLESGEYVDSHKPLELFENVNFYLRRTKDVGYRLSTAERLDRFYTDSYDFYMANVSVGQKIHVYTTAGAGEYTITSVDRNEISVTPPASTNFDFADFYVESDSSYIIFNDVTFDRSVEKLWAEYITVDNSPAVYSSFGKGVGLSPETWATVGFGNTYKDIIASLIKARVTASTLTSIEEIASGAIGMPLSPFYGRFVDIDEDFTTKDGLSLETRIVLEELDADGTGLGRLSSHIIKSNNDLRFNATSGLSINPETGVNYKVGDVVQRHSPIGRGITAIDLYSSEKHLFHLDGIVDRNRFAIIIDVDSTYGLASTLDPFDFLVRFINEVKPAHTNFSISLLKYLVDEINIESEVFLGYSTTFYDNPYHHRGPANIFDGDIPGTSDRDSAPLLVLTSWLPRDGSVSSIGGIFQLTSATGGFTDPTVISNFNSNLVGEWIKPGDGVELRNKSSITLEVVEVVDNNTLTMRAIDIADSVELNRIDLLQPFFVYRKLSDQVINNVTLTQDEDFDFRVVGITENNVGIGDKVSFVGSTGEHTGLLRITDLIKDNVSGDISLRVFPNRSPALFGDGELRVYREQIVDRFVKELVDTDKLISYGEWILGMGLSNYAAHLGIEPGDSISIGGYVACIREKFIFFSAPIKIEDLPSHIIISAQSSSISQDNLDEHELSVHSSVRAVFNLDIYVMGDLLISPYLKPGDIIFIEGSGLDTEEGYDVFRVGTAVASDAFITNIYPDPLGLTFIENSEDPQDGPAIGSPGREPGDQNGLIRGTIIRQDRLNLDYLISRRERSLRVFPFELTGWGSEHWRYRS